MRLLWLSHFVPYPPTGHGALQRSFHLLAQTAARFETHLVAVTAPGALDGDALAEAQRALEQRCASVTLVPLASSASADRLRRAALMARSLVSRRPCWEHFFWSDAAAQAVTSLVGRSAVDLAHVDTVFLRPYLDRLGSTPVVLNHHNVESHLLHRRAQVGLAPARAFLAAQARFVERAEVATASRVAHNLVVSDLDGVRLRELAPGVPVDTIRNGVDLEYFRGEGRAQPGGPARLVWAGGMDWFPNQDAIRWFATELWPALAADRADRQVDIIGRNPPAEIVELASRDARVRVHGFVDDVRPFLQRATAYVCPIRVGGGTRLKVLDALAMRVPLVGTSIGVEGLGLRESEHFLRADACAAFVSAVRTIEDDPDLARRLEANGRAHVESLYGWTRIGAELAEVYSAAAGGRGAARGRSPALTAPV